MSIFEACVIEKRFDGIVSECQICLKRSVGEKYRWPTEAVSVFFVQLCLELLSNEHTWGLSWWETIWTRYTKNYPLEGDNFLAKRQPFYGVAPRKNKWQSLSNEHTWSLSRLETIRVNCCWMSDLPRKICWRKIRAINRSCVCFLCPVVFRITI